MDNSLKPIEAFVNQGLAQRFQQIFGLPLVFSNSPDKRAAAAKLLQRGLKYPFAFASVISDGISENGYKPHTLWRRGLVSGKSDDGILAYRLNLIPVTTEYDITFQAQAFSDVRRFTKTWLLGSVQKAMKFSLLYGMVNLDINVECEPKLQVPERDGGVEEVKQYELKTTLTVSGYMSADELAKAQVINAVEATAYVGDPADIALLTPHERGTHEVFYFKSDQPDLTKTPDPVADPYDINDPALIKMIEEDGYSGAEQAMDDLHTTVNVTLPNQNT
jgi:hypothetical protein